MRRQALDACADVLRDRGGAVAVVNLKLVDRQMLAAMRDGEADKRKHYRAVCWASRPITPADKAALDSIRELELQQDTPVRVLHRRAPLVRTRVRFCSARCCCNLLSCPPLRLQVACTHVYAVCKRALHTRRSS